ncbi:MAG: acyl-ACP desaturase [Elusimicrobia bacterium]|nr:acyl-ACP desaturase [Elusimicrobiota bacterium]
MARAAAFDLEDFLARSRALDLSGIDWSRARAEPLSAAERRILPYFIDVESYTIAYLRALLNTAAIRDAEICDFLGCWLYEEAYHGRALARFLREAGHPLDPRRPKSVERPARAWEALQDAAASALSRAFAQDFVAVHMTWGAIQELSTLNGYRRLAERTENSALAEIVRRVMRDESRHFSFYYHKAEERLSRSPRAQRLTAFLVKRFWKPVGAGIMPQAEIDFLVGYLFSGPRGLEEVRHVDRTIARLPGMGWFRGLEDYVSAARDRLGRDPADAAQMRQGKAHSI